jgi:multiple sugar transport system permease protein
MRNGIVKRLKKQRWGYYFVLPSVLLFVLFVLWPFITAFITSFMQYDLGNKKFIGLDNYKRFLGDPIALRTIRNTLQYVSFIVPVVIVLSLFISLNIYKRGAIIKSYIRAVFYLPAIVPSVCLAVVWKWFYNPNFGLLNSIIGHFGAGTINFLGDPKIAIYSVMVIVITWTLGQPIVLYTAALGGIPETLLEAAEVDGVTGWKQFRHIIWPLLKPTTLYIGFSLTVGIMQVVEAIMLTTNGGPYYATNSMLLMIYNEAFKLNNLGYASAIGNVMFILIFIMSVIQFRFFSTKVEY